MMIMMMMVIIIIVKRTITILLTLAFFKLAISRVLNPMTKQNDICVYFLHQVTRYQGWPGQATAYMIGRLGILHARQSATSRLGEKFSLKDFHYQVM